jgi:hypothetical protein
MYKRINRLVYTIMLNVLYSKHLSIIYLISIPVTVIR